MRGMPDEQIPESFALLRTYGGPRAEEALRLLGQADFAHIVTRSREIFVSLKLSAARDESEREHLLREAVLAETQSELLEGAISSPGSQRLLAQVLEALCWTSRWGELVGSELALAHLMADFIARSPGQDKKSKPQSIHKGDWVPTVVNFVLWYVRTGGAVSWAPPDVAH